MKFDVLSQFTTYLHSVLLLFVCVMRCSLSCCCRSDVFPRVFRKRSQNQVSAFVNDRTGKFCNASSIVCIICLNC